MDNNLNNFFALYLIVTVLGLFVFVISPTNKNKTNMQIFAYLVMIVCWPLVAMVAFFIWCYLVCSIDKKRSE